ncbi:MAG: biotin transporter BioY [Candidatus Paceibacterota bacterium]|jgi:biotin transport system substrate-specific component|nr:biotin transporter BioY [Candidatus Paceibacterota bacterium]MDD5555309.1 biotin transporter BioY [Candidatus Paceibacterota bacterium]
MNASSTIKNYYVSSKSLRIAHKISLALGMAFLTGLLAQIRIYLPLTPVPVTGQVLGVLLSGAVCGSGFGALSQLIYVVFGLGGISWFALAPASLAGLFTSPTGGYLLGFIMAPLVIKRKRDFVSNLRCMLLGIAVIYLFGTTGLMFVLHTTPWNAIKLGILPFLAFDLMKAFVAAGILSYPRRPSKP